MSTIDFSSLDDAHLCSTFVSSYRVISSHDSLFTTFILLHVMIMDYIRHQTHISISALMFSCATQLTIFKLFCGAARESHEYTGDILIILPPLYLISVVRAGLLWNVLEMPQSGPYKLGVTGPNNMAWGLIP